jgi:hypothetical protein
MDHLDVSRVVVDTEPAWLRVKDNLAQGLSQIMSARLSTLPGGINGPAATAIRNEVEVRKGLLEATVQGVFSC